MEKFWTDISTEERTHAFMVRTFRTMIEDGTLVYEERPFTTRDLEAYLNDLNEHLKHARKGDLTITEALSTALEMESRVLEKQTFHFLFKAR